MTITIIIIAVTVAASFYAWNNQNIMSKWIFNPYQVSHHHQYYRFITSGFIHNDHIHLLFNMFTFYFFGRAIEQTYTALYGTAGMVFFVILYLVSIIIADLPTFFRHKNEPNYNSLGASGGVAAIVFSFILFFPTENLYLFAFLPIPGFLLGVLFIVYSYYAGKKSATNINHDAHLFGALFGIVFTILIEPNVLSRFADQMKDFQLF